MTTLVLTLPSPDGNRAFELLATLGEHVVLAETCIEVYSDGRREWRDVRSVLLAVGRKPETPA